MDLLWREGVFTLTLAVSTSGLNQPLRRIYIQQNPGILHFNHHATIPLRPHHRTRPFIPGQLPQRRPEIAPENHRVSVLPGMTWKHDFRSAGGFRQLPQSGRFDPRHITQQNRHRLRLAVD